MSCARTETREETEARPVCCPVSSGAFDCSINQTGRKYQASQGCPPQTNCTHFARHFSGDARVLTHVRCLASPTDSSSRYLTLRTLALPTLRILARLGAVDLSPSRDCVAWRSVWVDRIPLHKMVYHETAPYQVVCLIRQQFSHTA